MRFAEPQWLWALIGVFLLGLWLRRADRARRADLAALGDPSLVAALARGLETPRRRQRNGLRLAALALAVIALARPQWGLAQESGESSGRQVMLVLDVSTSMLAADLSPSRLDRAKIEIQALLDDIHGDQAGLVLFSGAAFNQVPLTVDHALLLDMLDLAGPGVISRPGTLIGAAIDAATRGFDPNRLADRAIVLLSDGEDPEPGAIEAARRAADEGVVVFAVGFGTEAGARLPETDDAGRQLQARGPDGQIGPAWIRDDSGQEVVSRLDERVLREIAAATGGLYIRAGAAGAAAAELADGLDRLERGELSAEIGARPVERFQWPAALALVMLLLADSPGGLPRSLRERASGDRRRLKDVDPQDSEGLSSGAEARAQRPPVSRASLGLLLGLLLPLSLAACGQSVSTINAKANTAFSEEDWAQAKTLYEQALAEDPDRAALIYNLGNTAYRQAEVEEARRLLQRALELGEDPAAPEIWYNLGTLALNAGELDSAVEAFKAVLRARPGDPDARHNLELALAAQTATPAATASGEPQGSGTPPDSGTPEPGGTPSPQSGEGTQEPGDAEASPEPGEEGEPSGDGQSGTPEPSETEASQEGEPGENAADPGDSENRQTLSPEQAERLLESLGQDIQSLQERLGQIYVVPGEPPAQRW